MKFGTIPRSVRVAVTVSQGLLIFWTCLQLLIYIFQTDVIRLMGGSAEGTERISVWYVWVKIAAAAVLSAANMLIIKEKGVYTPVVTASVTAGLLPGATAVTDYIQRAFFARLMSADNFVRYASLASAVSFTGEFYAAAEMITVAAAAVYAYDRHIRINTNIQSTC